MEADSDGSDVERPILTGLVLLPTGKKRQFSRVKQFELCEHRGRKEIETLTETTRILDPRFFVSRHKYGEYSIAVI